MKLDDATLNTIEKYLSNNMTNEEKKNFLIEIGNSNDIQEFLEINHQLELFKNNDEWVLQSIDKNNLKKVVQLFNEKDTQDFSKKIRSFQREYLNSKPKKTRKLIRYATLTGIAASFLLFFYISVLQQPDLATIYTNNSSWNELPSFTVKGDSSQLQLTKIERSFNEKKFEDVIQLSQQIIDDSKQIDPNLLIYKGVSQLELEQYEAALKTFTKLTKSNTLDHHKGYWYISLIYLKQENKKKAIETLQQIKEGTFMHEKAKSILNKIQ